MENIINEMKKDLSEWKSLRFRFEEVFKLADYETYDMAMLLSRAADKYITELERKLAELEQLIK